jgi:hypothetical protein
MFLSFAAAHADTACTVLAACFGFQSFKTQN